MEKNKGVIWLGVGRRKGERPVISIRLHIDVKYEWKKSGQRTCAGGTSLFLYPSTSEYVKKMQQPPMSMEQTQEINDIAKIGEEKTTCNGIGHWWKTNFCTHKQLAMQWLGVDELRAKPALKPPLISPHY